MCTLHNFVGYEINELVQWWLCGTVDFGNIIWVAYSNDTFQKKFPLVRKDEVREIQG